MRSLNGYTLKYYREFLPPIMLNLKLFKEDDGDMQNSIFSASINALIPINQCLVDECIAINTDFIESKSF